MSRITIPPRLAILSRVARWSDFTDHRVTDIGFLGRDDDFPDHAAFHDNVYGLGIRHGKLVCEQLRYQKESAEVYRRPDFAGSGPTCKRPLVSLRSLCG